MANVVEAVLTATDRSYTSTMQKAMKVTDTFAGKVKGGIGFGALLRIGERAVDGIGNAVKGLTGELDKTNATWRSFRSNMEMIGKGNEVDKVKKDLTDFASRTVYDTSEMAQTYSQLAAVGAKNTTELVKGFGMIASAAENPKQAMKTVSTQATQMAAKPKVAWQDFKLMLEQTPAGIAQVAKAMDMTTTELVKNVQDGKVKTEDFFNAIIKAGNDKTLQKMAQSYKTIGQATDGLTESLVNKLAPAYDKISTAAIDRIVQIMDAMDGLDFGNLAERVGVGVDKINGFIDSMLAKIEEAGGMAPVLKGLGAALAGLALAPQLGQATKALTLFNKALFGLNAGTAGLAALNPALLLAGVLVGAGMLYSAFGDQIDALIEMATTKGAEIITSLGEGITSRLPDIMAKGAELITNLLNAITANIPAILEQGTNIIITLVQGVTSALPQLLTAAANALGQFVIGVAQALPQLLTTGLQLIATLVQGIASNIPQLLTSALTAVAQFAVGIIQNLPQILQAGWDILVALCQGILSAIVNIPQTIKTVYQSIKDAIKGNKGDIESAGKDTGQSLTESVAQSAASNQSTVAAAGTDTGLSFTTGLSDSISGFSVDISNVTSGLTAAVPQAQSAGTEIGQSFESSLTSAVGAVNVDTSNVVQAMQQTVPQAQSAGQQIGQSFAQSLQQTAPQARTAGQQLGQNFGQGMQSTQGQITSASSALGQASVSQLGNGYSKAYQTGAYISQGLAAGMRSCLSQVRAAAAQLSAAADEAMRAKAKVNSPSKVTTQTGMYVGEGLVVGILKKIKAADTAGKKIVGSMLTTMKAATKKGNFEAVGNSVIKKITNTLTNGATSINNAFDSVLERLQEAYSDRMEDLGDNKALRKAMQKEQKTLTKRLTALQDKLAKAFDNEKERTERRLENLAGTYQAKYDAIVDLKKDFAARLGSVDQLFKTKNGKVIFADFDAERKKVNALSKNIEKLKKVLPRGLMDEIVQMDTADQLKYTNAMLKMSSKDLKAYGQSYTKLQSASNKAATTFYSDRVNEVKNNYTKAVTKEFTDLKARLSKVGTQAIQGFADGMKKNKKYLDKSTLALVNSIIDTAKKKLKIHSPSKVFETIGVYTGEGMAQGIDSTQRQVQASIDNMLQAADFNRRMANRRFNGSLSDEYDYNIAARYEVVVPLEVNGREFARATADDITAVQNQRESYSNRKRGIR